MELFMALKYKAVWCMSFIREPRTLRQVEKNEWPPPCRLEKRLINNSYNLSLPLPSSYILWVGGILPADMSVPHLIRALLPEARRAYQIP